MHKYEINIHIYPKHTPPSVSLSYVVVSIVRIVLGEAAETTRLSWALAAKLGKMGAQLNLVAPFNF